MNVQFVVLKRSNLPGCKPIFASQIRAEDGMRKCEVILERALKSILSDKSAGGHDGGPLVKKW